MWCLARVVPSHWCMGSGGHVVRLANCAQLVCPTLAVGLFEASSCRLNTEQFPY